MSLADDNDINIYYTDTDSIHIDEAGVEPLAKLYEKKYNQKLIGKRLGQFHCDFECEGLSKIKSIGLITLGKKSYIDKLEGVDANGNVKHDYHVRLKGISPAAIEDHITKEQKHNASYDKFELYKRLFGGEAIQFDMKVNNKVRFQKSKDQEFYTFSGNFKRSVKF